MLQTLRHQKWPTPTFTPELFGSIMSSFFVSFSAYDRANRRHLYVKADGQRFTSNQTLKVCCDVKYDVTVTVKPPQHKLQKLTIGGDTISPDSSKSSDDSNEYLFTWLTTGFAATPSGKRGELRLVFHFENAEVAATQQVKFYALAKSSHLTWGTEVHRIDFEARGRPPGEAAVFQNLVPTKVSFK